MYQAGSVFSYGAVAARNPEIRVFLWLRFEDVELPDAFNSVIDHAARAEISRVVAEQARIVATIEALRDRIEREGSANLEALKSQSTAIEALAHRFTEEQIEGAFLRGQGATRWAMIGFAASSAFMVLGAAMSFLFKRAFGAG